MSSLSEKEVLLKEVHHRVKNNLQVISSLLSLQAGYAKDEEADEMFRESRNRVKSMALVHEKLYQSRELSRINFAEYLNELATDLFRAYGVDPRTVSLRIDVGDVFLGVDTAVHCGLIVNELLSNCLKHAFPAGRKGSVSITLRPSGDNRLRLTVRDDGVGFPKDVDFRNTKTLGLQLVQTLVQQLDGTADMHSNGGTTFDIDITTQRHLGAT
jgi:two-component sensor histidine kinase